MVRMGRKRKWLPGTENRTIVYITYTQMYREGKFSCFLQDDRLKRGKETAGKGISPPLFMLVTVVVGLLYKLGYSSTPTKFLSNKIMPHPSVGIAAHIPSHKTLAHKSHVSCQRSQMVSS